MDLYLFDRTEKIIHFDDLSILNGRCKIENFAETMMSENEIFVFQLAFVSEADDIIKNIEYKGDVKISCINTDITDKFGKKSVQSIAVKKNRIQPLFFTVKAEKLGERQEKCEITINTENEKRSFHLIFNINTSHVENNGYNDLWRLSRIKWLNSDLYMDESVVKPYVPPVMHDGKIEILGRDIIMGDDGLPVQICSKFSESVEVEEAVQKKLFYKAPEFSINGSSIGAGKRMYSEHNNRIEMLTLIEKDDYSAVVMGMVRYEGCMEYSVKITPKHDFKAKNVSLDLYISEECSLLMHGLGHRASKAENLSFKWDNQKQQDSIFIGCVNCGMRLKLKAENYIRPLVNIFYKNLPLKTPVETWDNHGRGGITITKHNGYTHLSAFTGEFDYKENETREFLFEMHITPLNLIAWIFGHYHYNYVYENNGVVNISAPRPDCGGIDSSPASTRVININENGEISTKSHYYDLGKSKNPENTIWNTKLDGNVLFCDTVYDGTSVYTAVVNDDYVNSGAVYRIDANSGEIKWTFSTKNSVKNNICMDENRLVSMDADGNVYCLDKADGKLLWEKKLDLGNALGTSSGICINNGVIFAGASRVVTALDVKNGDAKWSVNRDKGENSPAEFVVTDGKLLVNSHWDALSALDIENGKTLWDNNDEDIRFRSSTPIAVDDKTILVADDNAVMFVNSDDGKMISKTCYDEYSFNTSAQPAYRGNTVYIPTSNEGIVAFDMENKEILWNFKTEENILFTAPYVGKGAKTVESSPVIDGDKLIFGANDGYIYSVNAKTGNLIKKYFAGTAVLGEIAVCDDKIYASSFGGYVMCFEK